MKIKTAVRAGGFNATNHNQNSLKVKTKLRAGSLTANHNQNASTRQ